MLNKAPENKLNYWYEYSDMFESGVVASRYSIWDVAVLASGTLNYTNDGANHPGIVQLITSTTTNSGGRILTQARPFVLGKGEYHTVIFRHDNVTNSLIRTGFLDQFNQTTPVYGVYFTVVGGVLKGTRARTTELHTGTTYTLNPAKWYRASFQVCSTLTCVYFQLYEDGVLVWSDSITGTLIEPNTYWNGLIATNSGTSAGVILASVDFIEIGHRVPLSR